ncbi:MAG TPA: DUF6351 family protein, partial [Myxococcales bacterium]
MLARARWIYPTLVLLAVLGTSKWTFAGDDGEDRDEWQDRDDREDRDRDDRFGIRTLSTRPDRVSGGDVLVEVSFPHANPRHPLIISLNGRDVSAAFRPGDSANTLVGLVTGLALGKNTLRVEGKGWGRPHESLELTNYPVTG